MVWFVMKTIMESMKILIMFQTKLTYGMICYNIENILNNVQFWRFKLSWLMVWFVISIPGFHCVLILHEFQTKLTYGMICYKMTQTAFGNQLGKFQTKLTYGMICYQTTDNSSLGERGFQTKLTYGMICY